MTTTRPSLSVTRQALLDRLSEVMELAGEVYDELEKAHNLNYLETLDFYRAKEHAAAGWRAIEYASQAVRDNTRVSD